jgi:DNA-binding beta-propeller fold protein YncE
MDNKKKTQLALLKKGLSAAVCLMLWVGTANHALADEPESEAPDQKSYTTTYWGSPAESPDPYVIENRFTGEKSGCGNFLNPSDIFRENNGDLYISDTGNNRIVVLNGDGDFVKEYKGANDGGSFHQFNAPEGVFVTGGNEIYVADTKNGVIVHMDSQGI